MSIQAFISQPAADSFYAAYRPIPLRVSATANSGGGLVPPVVYCDIYFNGTFYKTLSKTQYTSLGGSNSEWLFDIQDAAQEFLQKYIAPIAQSFIEDVTPIICEVFCRFRCSGFDTNGFIESDGTAPIQATSSSAAVAGTGNESNTFYVVNSTLQHKDSQDLPTHLNAYKTGTWATDVYPLSHRIRGYALMPGNSDQFPIIDAGGHSMSAIRLNYRNCNQSTFGQAEVDSGVIPTCNVVISPPTAQFNSSGWLISWNLVSGTPNKYFVSTPAVSGGAPQETLTNQYQLPDLPEGEHIVTVRPICLIEGEFYPGAAQTVTITVEPCEELVSVEGGIPDAIEGVVYNHSLAVVGGLPIDVGLGPHPAWMSITVSGSNVILSGTPPSGSAGTGILVEFAVLNCGETVLDFSETIDVTAAPETDNFTITCARAGSSITNVTPVIWENQSGSFPLGNGQSVVGDLVDPFTGVVNVTVSLVSGSGTLRLLENGIPLEFVVVSGSGTFPIPSNTYNPANEYLIVLTP